MLAWPDPRPCAEYTYTLNVPFRMDGKKSAFAKELDELVRSLSPKDRRVFDRFGGDGCLDFDTWFKEMPMRTVFQRYEARLKEVERKMTEARGQPETFAEMDDQKRAVERELHELVGREEVQKFLRGRMENCLGDAGMSSEGRQAVANFWFRLLWLSGQR